MLPARRGSGLGRALIQRLTEILLGQGVQVLRASVPAGGAASKRRLAAAGYSPIFFVMRRDVDSL